MNTLRCHTCKSTVYEPCPNDLVGCKYDEGVIAPKTPIVTGTRRRVKSGSSDKPENNDKGYQENFYQ